MNARARTAASKAIDGADSNGSCMPRARWDSSVLTSSVMSQAAARQRPSATSRRAPTLAVELARVRKPSRTRSEISRAKPRREPALTSRSVASISSPRASRTSAGVGEQRQPGDPLTAHDVAVLADSRKRRVTVRAACASRSASACSSSRPVGVRV